MRTSVSIVVMSASLCLLFVLDALAAAVAVRAAMPVRNRCILVVGDSLSAGYGIAVEPTAGWPCCSSG